MLNELDFLDSSYLKNCLECIFIANRLEAYRKKVYIKGSDILLTQSL